eukprot:TRINITY_DN4517_c0_g1_i9.p3 TRINITY_DN4517_c0_g1~~TRINITY_DN4517_c0_g1_i9.p3  ORF type:complete len:142 (+),score=21.50 TRINITY_DN4517_c0_g1_i9:128-553(+)
MDLLLVCGELYAPESRGVVEIFVAGGVIQSISPVPAHGVSPVRALVESLRGRVIDVVPPHFIAPGLVDQHVHVTGGGGEKGPASRVPEAQIEEIVEGGVTTVVGVLGTDCVSRSLENLLFKTRALQHDGITAYMYTGSYRA